MNNDAKRALFALIEAFTKNDNGKKYIDEEGINMLKSYIKGYENKNENYLFPYN